MRSRNFLPLFFAPILLTIGVIAGASPAALGAERPGDAISARDFGAKADGITDDSAAVIRACTAAVAAGKVCRLERNTVLNNVVLSGPSFDHLRLEAPFWIHGAKSLVGFSIENAHDISYSGTCDQRKETQPANEHVTCLALLGVQGARINATNLNLRGDGVYISAPDGGKGAPSENITGTVICRNTVDDGRNCVSIITGRHIKFHVESNRVGAAIGGINEPGGVDLEPNFATQAIDDVSIDGTLVCGAHATACLQTYGRPGQITNISFSVTMSCPDAAAGRVCGSVAGVNKGRVSLRVTGLARPRVDDALDAAIFFNGMRIR